MKWGLKIDSSVVYMSVSPSMCSQKQRVTGEIVEWQGNGQMKWNVPCENLGWQGEWPGKTKCPNEKDIHFCIRNYKQGVHFSLGLVMTNIEIVDLWNIKKCIFWWKSGYFYSLQMDGSVAILCFRRQIFVVIGDLNGVFQLCVGELYLKRDQTSKGVLLVEL